MKENESRIDQAVAAVLAYPRLEDAAHHCGVSRTTLWRWMQDEEFQERLDEVREEQTQRLLDTLQANALEAVRILCEVMRDREAPLSARVAASTKLIDLSFRASNQAGMKTRLEMDQARAEAAEMKALLQS